MLYEDTVTTIDLEIGGRTMTIETGRMAKQANGSVWVSYGGTRVLVTVCHTDPRPGLDFFPMTVNYQEGHFAAGKIPGGFFKREGRPRDSETLVCRMIDRPIRPLFADGYNDDTQIIATVYSYEPGFDPDIPAMLGASAALHISRIPFLGPIAAVRVGYVDGQLIANPDVEQKENSELELTVAASKDAIVMVEGGANHLPEDVMLNALMFAHESIQPAIEAQEKLREMVGVEKLVPVPPEKNEDMAAKVKDQFGSKLNDAIRISEKMARYAKIDEVKKEAKEALVPEDDDGTLAKDFKSAWGELKSTTMRTMIKDEKKRIDGRGFRDIRPIKCEIDVLPKCHGSALFTRGETQALVNVTLGTRRDEQRMDEVAGEWFKRFMLHYNFPPFSVGEVRMLRSAGRREIGHGMLAERSVDRVLPEHEDFPYTIRVVSDILESNGSSSMATVCGASLALMDTGVPIEKPVAGIAMGLIQEGGENIVLSDILGDEDHLGDMDFKVTGSADGICALQMDIKVGGITREIFAAALEQAREGRMHILGEMAKAIDKPREELNPNAPRIVTIKIDPDKVRDIIGPGGKVIKGIVLATGCDVDVDDSGEIKVCSKDLEALEKAVGMIEEMTQEPELGRVYEGPVKRIEDYGAFVEIFPGRDGLLHISEIDFQRTERVTDVLREGDITPVKVIEVDPSGKVRLSRTQALADRGEAPEGWESRPSRGGGGGGGGGGRGRDDRGGRGGGRGRDDRGGRGGGGRGGGGRDRDDRKSDDRGGDDRGGRGKRRRF